MVYAGQFQVRAPRRPRTLSLIQGLLSPATVFRSGPCAGATADGCNFWVARDSTRTRTSQFRGRDGSRCPARWRSPAESRYRQPKSGLVHAEVTGAKTDSPRLSGRDCRNYAVEDAPTVHLGPPRLPSTATRILEASIGFCAQHIHSSSSSGELESAYDAPQYWYPFWTLRDPLAPWGRRDG